MENVGDFKEIPHTPNLFKEKVLTEAVEIVQTLPNPVQIVTWYTSHNDFLTRSKICDLLL